MKSIFFRQANQLCIPLPTNDLSPVTQNFKNISLLLEKFTLICILAVYNIDKLFIKFLKVVDGGNVVCLYICHAELFPFPETLSVFESPQIIYL